MEIRGVDVEYRAKTLPAEGFMFPVEGGMWTRAGSGPAAVRLVAIDVSHWNRGRAASQELT